MNTVPKLQWYKLMRYVEFETWWEEVLKNRENKLVDLDMNEMMALSKRKFIERATFEDLLTYLTERDCPILVYKQNGYTIFIREKEYTSELSFMEALMPFLLVYLEDNRLNIVNKM